jgi:hypothetical protein
MFAFGPNILREWWQQQQDYDPNEECHGAIDDIDPLPSWSSCGRFGQITNSSVRDESTEGSGDGGCRIHYAL